MKKLNEIEYLSLQEPYNIKELKNEQKNDFLYLYSLYYYWLINYLIVKVKINDYDNMVGNDKNHFLPLTDDNKDVYQLLTSNLLKFFYVRNVMHIDRLSQDEINNMFMLSNQNNQNFNKEQYNFIDKTINKVIVDYDNIDEKGIEINYGPDSDSFFAPNDALVLGFRFDEFNLNGMNQNEWLINRLEQYQFLENLFPKMEKEISKKINMPCKIIQYNEYSVIIDKEKKEK